MLSGSSNKLVTLIQAPYIITVDETAINTSGRETISFLVLVRLIRLQSELQEYKWERTTLSLPNAQITTHLILLQWWLQIIQVEEK